MLPSLTSLSGGLGGVPGMPAQFPELHKTLFTAAAPTGATPPPAEPPPAPAPAPPVGMGMVKLDLGGGGGAAAPLSSAAAPPSGGAPGVPPVMGMPKLGMPKMTMPKLGGLGASDAAGGASDAGGGGSDAAGAAGGGDGGGSRTERAPPRPGSAGTRPASAGGNKMPKLGLGQAAAAPAPALPPMGKGASGLSLNLKQVDDMEQEGPRPDAQRHAMLTPCSRHAHAVHAHMHAPCTHRAHAMHMHMPWQEKVDPLYERDNRAEKLRHFSKICSELTPQIYLGGDVVAQNLEQLQSHGITHVRCAAAATPCIVEPARLCSLQPYLCRLRGPVCAACGPMHPRCSTQRASPAPTTTTAR